MQRSQVFLALILAASSLYARGEEPFYPRRIGTTFDSPTQHWEFCFADTPVDALQTTSLSSVNLRLSWKPDSIRLDKVQLVAELTIPQKKISAQKLILKDEFKTKIGKKQDLAAVCGSEVVTGQILGNRVSATWMVEGLSLEDVTVGRIGNVIYNQTFENAAIQPEELARFAVEVDDAIKSVKSKIVGTSFESTGEIVGGLGASCVGLVQCFSEALSRAPSSPAVLLNAVTTKMFNYPEIVRDGLVVGQ